MPARDAGSGAGLDELAVLDRLGQPRSLVRAALAAAQLVARQVDRDAHQPRSPRLVGASRGGRSQRAREGLLHEVVRVRRAAGHAVAEPAQEALRFSAKTRARSAGPCRASAMAPAHAATPSLRAPRRRVGRATRALAKLASAEHARRADPVAREPEVARSPSTVPGVRPASPPREARGRSCTTTSSRRKRRVHDTSRQPGCTQSRSASNSASSSSREGDSPGAEIASRPGSARRRPARASRPPSAPRSRARGRCRARTSRAGCGSRARPRSRHAARAGRHALAAADRNGFRPPSTSVLASSGPSARITASQAKRSAVGQKQPARLAVVLDGAHAYARANLDSRITCRSRECVDQALPAAVEVANSRAEPELQLPERRACAHLVDRVRVAREPHDRRDQLAHAVVPDLAFEILGQGDTVERRRVELGQAREQLARARASPADAGAPCSAARRARRGGRAGDRAR